jgi:hypothetical protein
MGNEFSALCNCTDNRKDANLEHITRVNERVTQPEQNENYMVLERVKNNPLKKRVKFNTYASTSINNVTPEEETIDYEDGSKYIGFTKDGMKEGKGKLLTLTCVYEGEFQKDTFHGLGKYEDSEITYEGDFTNGERNGKGIQILRKEDYKYIGEWKNGIKTGLGNEYLPDKSHYEGYFVDGKKNGTGKLILSNGSVYVGEFKSDKLDGNVRIINFREH